MTKTNTPKITEVKRFKTEYVVGNTIVATREQLKYKTNTWNHWQTVGFDEDIQRITDIESLDYYHFDKLTPEGEKMLAEAKAKKEEDEEDDD